MYLLTFAMWEYNEFWDDGTLSPEWSDDALTPESVLATNPLGHALFTKYIAPIVSKPEKAILLDIFQDNDQGAHGYVADTLEKNTISIVVDEGVVSDSAITVSDLVEERIINGDKVISHTIEYGGQDYKYDDVKDLVMIFLRNDDFTPVFQNEIAESFPDYSEVTYSEVISLVGLGGVSDTILQVASTDGYFLA